MIDYCLSHLTYKRIPSKEVQIGDVPVGGKNPIRIQSMTTTDTMDTLGTVEQCLRMVEAGCEYLRITAPSKKEAENLAEIKKELLRRGCKTPLVADIHYTPNAAEIAARIVAKVRVNPGNYADKKRFQEIEYTDASYQSELQRIYDRFSPLVKICKEEGTAMRIGTNHGSLSDRIMSRYGDTPLGMVESALEFVRICEDHNFRNLVISMKASNPQVMVQAYRLLLQKMLANDWVYPLHLGVTEAGEGEDGRVKSALGIATLLMDGIGDTVRVSLTEEPEHEMPVAKFLVDYFTQQENNSSVERSPINKIELPFDPYSFSRKKRSERLNIGGEQVPRVIADIKDNCKDVGDLKEIGYTYSKLLDKYNFSDIAADFAYFSKEMPAYDLPGGLKPIFDASYWRMLKDKESNFPLFSDFKAFLQSGEKHEELNFIKIQETQIEEILKEFDALNGAVFVLESPEAVPVYGWRAMIYALEKAGFKNPILLSLPRQSFFSYYADEQLPDYVRISKDAKAQLATSASVSTLLVDGLVDGLWLQDANHDALRTAFNMLQLARLRITKTEYISCPSCGRTLFDLQETTARIRMRTEHLKGVKIGIMGCIVNGPGEMADADYGYVGVGPGKISLYRGKEVVEKGVPTEYAVDKLIDLIRADGRWIEQEEPHAIS